MASRQTPRDIALAQLEEHLGTTARIEAEHAAAVAELASLQERAGEEVLADESAAGRLSGQMRDLRDRIDILARAIAAAAVKLQATRVQIVLLDAELWEQEITRRRSVLAAHEAVTADLLAQLENHEGKFVQARRASLHAEAPGVVESGGHIDTGRRPTSDLLKLALLRAELRAMICREVALGNDPRPALDRHRSLVSGHVAGVPLAELYPSSVWGPQAILPLPGSVAGQPILVTIDRPETPAVPADRAEVGATDVRG